MQKDRWPKGKRENEQGIALISVLWALMILSIMVMTVFTIASVQGHYSDNMAHKAQAEALADAGIYLSIQKLSERGSARKFPEKLSTLQFQYGGKDIKVRLIPETGKIDLNMAHEVLISAVLGYHGVDDATASEIAENIRYLRTDSTEKPFKIVSDIRRFKVIDAQLYRCIEPYLSVYSNRLGVNYATASDDMRNMIKWADKVRWGGQNWLEISGTATGSLVSGTRSVLQQSGSHAGKAYTLQAEVDVSEDVSIQRTAVIRMTGNRSTPFWVYRWDTTYGRKLDCKRLHR